MPEGPEVTITANSLNKLVANCELTEVKILGGRYSRTPLANLDKIIGHKILAVKNKGKFIYWQFDNSFNLFSTLGMSGGYSTSKNTYSTIEFLLDKSKLVWYTDVRQFGTKKVADNAELQKKLKELGPDMLNDPCSYIEFEKILKKNEKWKLGPFLLEQKKISGIGNIYKSEICYLAAVNPSRTLSSFSEEEKFRIYTSIKEILVLALKCGGSSQKDFKDIDGTFGSFLVDHANVYRRTTDRLGNKVESCDLNDGRTTWWVPNVQR